MCGVYCNQQDVELKAGANAATLSGAFYDILITEAESYINSAMMIDLSGSYATLADATKKILQDATASYAAVSAINYDMSGFTSRAEAITMINVNWAKMQEDLRLLRDKKRTDFIEAS